MKDASVSDLLIRAGPRVAKREASHLVLAKRMHTDKDRDAVGLKRRHGVLQLVV